MKSQIYIDCCPIGCNAALEQTDISLVQGCLLRCTKCGQMFSQCTKTDYTASMQEFNSSSGTWPRPENVSSLERSTGKTLEQITRLTKKNINQVKLLDVGCSNGPFIFVACKMGVTCEGVEPAKEAALAAQQAGLNVRHGFLEDLSLPGESYDIITLFEVIEHLKNPSSLLNECCRLLKKDGIMVIRTANTDSWTVRAIKGKWHYFNIRRHGGHISFFCEKSMTALARRTGFQLIKFKTHSVTLCEKENASLIGYRFFKMISEVLNLPAKLTGRGQEMEVYLKKG